MGVPHSHYALGVTRDERTCFVLIEQKWAVFYSERGRMEDKKDFDLFDDAKAHLLARLQNVL
jgi:hypothetical protein